MMDATSSEKQHLLQQKRRIRVCAFFCTFVILIGWNTNVNGQTQTSVIIPAPAPSVSGVPGGPPALASDTGRMKAPYHEFEHYVTPGMCKTAAFRLDEYAWKIPWRDTSVVRSQEYHPIPPAISIARQCMSRFVVATTPEQELRNLLDLAIITEQTYLADSIIERRLQLATAVLDSGQVLLEAVTAYLNAQPSQFDKAVSYANRLDAMGTGVASHRLLAWSSIIDYDVWINLEVDRISGYWHNIDLALGAMSPEAKDEFGGNVTASIQQTFNPGWWLDTVPRDIMIQRLERIRSQHEALNLRNGFYLKRIHTDPDRGSFFPRTPAPPIEATYQFHNEGIQLPRRGRVTLLLQIPGFTGPRSYWWYAQIRRFRERYDSSQLDIIISTKTQGFNPSGIVTPDIEAESLRRYFLDYHKLPVTLLVHETPFVIRDDGRRIDQPTAFETAYPYYLTLIDKNMIARVGIPPLLLPDAMLEWHIDRMLAEPVKNSSRHEGGLPHQPMPAVAAINM